MSKDTSSQNNSKDLLAKMNLTEEDKKEMKELVAETVESLKEIKT